MVMSAHVWCTHEKIVQIMDRLIDTTTADYDPSQRICERVKNCWGCPKGIPRQQ